MSSLSDARELPRPVGAELLIGVASPLWGYFSGIAVTGVAWWWMTRLAPQNLEALFASATPALPAVGQMEAAVEIAVEVVGGEAAPVSPVLEVADVAVASDAPVHHQALLDASVAAGEEAPETTLTEPPPAELPPSGPKARKMSAPPVADA